MTVRPYGVLAALRERDRSGLGQVVSTSLLTGQIAIHVFQGMRWLIAGEVPEPAGNHHPTVCPYGLFPTADSAIVIAVGNNAIWKRFAPLVGLRFDDPRFATNHDRVSSREELEEAVRTGLHRQDSATWLQAFDEAGVPAGEVKTLDRLYGSEQVRAEGLICEVTHPTLGVIQLPGPPLRFGRSPATSDRAPPTLGQHAKDIKESCGCRLSGRAMHGTDRRAGTDVGRGQARHDDRQRWSLVSESLRGTQWST